MEGELDKKKSKILITGAKGQLGTILSAKLLSRYEVIPLSSKELDITDKNKVLEYIQANKPDIVINCAAYNNVDEGEYEVEKCRQVNEIGIENLAIATKNLPTLLVHISTDFVFDGTKQTPYTENDMPNPINNYGLSKYRGEEAIRSIKEKHLIIRTSWLYSDMDISGNFFNTICKLARSRKSIKVVNDQVGTPTNAYDLAEQIITLIEQGKTGLFHCSGNGECSRYEFAYKIVELIHAPCEVLAITTEEYGMQARRPKYSALCNDKYINATGNGVKNWEEVLKTFTGNISI